MLQINAPREHTFAEPLGLLSDCHRRIKNFLEILLRVTRTLRTDELTPDARNALETSLRYFRDAAPIHTRDEEESLFPRLREIAAENGADAQPIREALGTVDRLEADHDIADVSHALVDEIGRKWLAEGRLSESEIEQLEAELNTLRDFYADHIEVEDNQLFPLAAKVLDEPLLEKIGREMARRRGVPFNRPD